MQTLSLRSRIFLSYALLISMVAGLVLFYAYQQVNETIVGGHHEELDEHFGLIYIEMEELVAVQLEEDELNLELIYAELTELARTLDVHITLFSVEFDEVLYNSRPGVGVENFEEREEVQLLMEGEEVHEVEDDELEFTYRTDILYVGDESELIVRVGEPWYGFRANLRRQQIGAGAVTLVVGLVALFGLGGWLANTLTRSLTELRQTAQTMASGDLGTRAETNAPPEIRLLAEDFNSMAEAVEAMVAEQQAFASNAAHELRTPLTAIRLRTETLLEDDPDAELTQRYVNEIDYEARRLSRLVDDLRLLSRSDSTRLEPGRDQVDIGRLLQAIQHEFRSQLASKQHTLSMSVPEEPIIVQASMNHLRIVLRNLVENAIKYTPENGRIEVRAASSAEQVTITVQDNGFGIAAENLPKLFTRFYRVDESHSRTIPGSGLGLSLVQSIVRLYDGTIEVASEGLGRGTTATIALPR